MLCSRDIALRKSFYNSLTALLESLYSSPFGDVNTLEYDLSACTGNNHLAALCGWPTLQADKQCYNYTMDG